MAVQIFSTSISPNTNVTMALSDDGYAINRAQIMTMRGDDIRGIVSINACFYIEEADLITGIEFLIGNIDEPIVRPNNYIVVSIAKTFTSSLYHDTGGAPFGGTQVLQDSTITISPNGGIFFRCAGVTTPSTLASVDYVLIPVVISYIKLEEVSVET